MLFFTIGGGKSVNQFRAVDIQSLAGKSFTFACNDSSFKFPCDIVVALDFQWLIDHHTKLLQLGKPIITREWSCLEGSKLPLIVLPNEIVNVARLSGQAAVKIADTLASMMNSQAYTLGIDGGAGHYYDEVGDCSDKVAPDSYQKLKCSRTVVLGNNPGITCWPNELILPTPGATKRRDRDWALSATTSMAKQMFRDIML